MTILAACAGLIAAHFVFEWMCWALLVILKSVAEESESPRRRGRLTGISY